MFFGLFSRSLLPAFAAFFSVTMFRISMDITLLLYSWLLLVALECRKINEDYGLFFSVVDLVLSRLLSQTGRRFSFLPAQRSQADKRLSRVFCRALHSVPWFRPSSSLYLNCGLSWEKIYPRAFAAGILSHPWFQPSSFTVLAHFNFVRNKRRPKTFVWDTALFAVLEYLVKHVLACQSLNVLWLVIISGQNHD